MLPEHNRKKNLKEWDLHNSVITKLALIFIGFSHLILHPGQSINNVHKIIPGLCYISFWRKAPVLTQMGAARPPHSFASTAFGGTPVNTRQQQPGLLA